MDNCYLINKSAENDIKTSLNKSNLFKQVKYGRKLWKCFAHQTQNYPAWRVALRAQLLQNPSSLAPDRSEPRGERICRLKKIIVNNEFVKKKNMQSWNSEEGAVTPQKKWNDLDKKMERLGYIFGTIGTSGPSTGTTGKAKVMVRTYRLHERNYPGTSIFHLSRAICFCRIRRR